MNQALADAYALLKTGTLWHNTLLASPKHPCKGFADANPGEAAQIDAYVAAVAAGQTVTPPVLATATGQGLVGIIASLAPAVAPPPPPPPPPPPAVAAKALFAGTVGPDLSVALAHGIKSVRIDIYALDKTEVDTFHAAGGSVIPIIDYNPWSDLRPSGTGDHYAPDTAARMATWSQRQMAAVTSKFAARPDALEVWNEPWLQGFWNQGPNPGSFLALCEAFAAEAWKTWPDVPILVSADSGWGGWCDKLVAADTSGFLKDPRVFPTVHPYCNNRAPGYHSATTQDQKDYDYDRWKFTYAIWKAHGAADPKVWLTEFGWVTDTAGQHYGSEGPAVTESVQAQYMADAYELAYTSGQVARAYSYMLSPNQTWSYNWLRADNSEKPVVAKVKAWVAS